MSHRRRQWTIAAVGLVTGILGVTVGAAVASHQFSDVGDGSAFHEAIGNVNDAGCASGFPDGSFRPTEDVRRQQAAYWLDACLGRGDVVQVADSWTASAGDDVTEAELVVQSGSLPGVGQGGSYLVMADIDVDTSGDQQSSWTLQHLDTPNPGDVDDLDDAVVTVLGTLNPDLDLNPSDGETIIGFVSEVEPGGTETFRVVGTREGGVPLANVDVTLAAMWMPFRNGVNG